MADSGSNMIEVRDPNHHLIFTVNKARTMVVIRQRDCDTTIRLVDGAMQWDCRLIEKA